MIKPNLECRSEHYLYAYNVPTKHVLFSFFLKTFISYHIHIIFPHSCFLGIKRIQFSTLRVRNLFMSFFRVMAIIADFMLLWLHAPTVSLRLALAIRAGPFGKFFYGCPDNAFQVIMLK